VGGGASAWIDHTSHRYQLLEAHFTVVGGFTSLGLVCTGAGALFDFDIQARLACTGPRALAWNSYSGHLLLGVNNTFGMPEILRRSPDNVFRPWQDEDSKMALLVDRKTNLMSFRHNEIWASQPVDISSFMASCEIERGIPKRSWSFASTLYGYSEATFQLWSFSALPEYAASFLPPSVFTSQVSAER
jgi:hypothetical protein